MMRTSRFSFMGIWMKATKIPGMMTSSFPQKKIPRTLQPMMTRQQGGSCAADRRLQKTTGMPATTPVIAAKMVATTAATAAAAMAAAMMTPARLPHTSAANP
jgi:hypothetical protein